MKTSKLLAFLVVVLSCFNTDAQPTNALYTLTMPQSCAEQTFCSVKPNNYPQELVDDLLGNISVNINANDSYPIDRAGSEDSSICETKIDFHVIYQIVDDNDKIRWVVQSDNKLIQKIHGRPCMHPGRLYDSRVQISYSQLESANISCETVTMDYTFLVLSEDMRRLDVAKNKGGVPVGCQPKYYG